MINTLTMGGTTVWSVSLKSAFGPSKIAFVKVSKNSETAALETALDGASLTVCTAQTNTAWKTISSDKYMVIGGNAKAVAAAFVNESASTSNRETLSMDSIGASAQYEITVCPTDEQGKVTDAGKVTAPAAPQGEDGFTFGGWRGFKYDANGKASEAIYAAGAEVPVRANTTLSAVWTPKKPAIDLDANGGEGGSSVTQVDYGAKLNIAENPTKNGFAFDGWTVRKAVVESGVSFAKGSPFDLSTPITDDLELSAKWKHVHSYSCVPLNYPGFNGAMDDCLDYLPFAHIRLCGCSDMELESHTFRNGVCTGCGYTKPDATEVKLEVFYWKDGESSKWITRPERIVKKDQEVTVEAFDQIGHFEFSKWQYSTTNGKVWDDMTADTMAGFIIPCSMQVRAIYVDTRTEPKIELSARSYETEAQGYIWDTVLFEMNYELPDGYTFVDAGVRMGDNARISYYEMKELKQSTGEKAAEVGMSLGFNLIPFVGGGLTGFLTDQTMDALSDDGPQYYYAERENSVLDELTAETLAEYMMNFKPVNVEKYPPIYSETKVKTKSQCGSVNTLTQLGSIQKNNGMHYIYGMAWMKYKDKNGDTQTLYTEAIPVTRDSVPGYTVKATPNGMSNTKQS